MSGRCLHAWQHLRAGPWINIQDLARPAGAELRAGAGGQDYDGPRNATRLNSALRFALAQMEPDRASRLLALTDGFSTEPLEDMAERLAKQVKGSGFPVFINETSGNDGKRLFWVRVGPEADQPGAAALSARLKAAGHRDARVVSYP